MGDRNPLSEVATLRLAVEGSSLQASEMERLLDVTVEQDLVLPDMFVLRFRDQADQYGAGLHHNFPMLDADRFPIGGSVQIDMALAGSPRRVLTGEITSLDLEAHAGGVPVLTVRGYDLAYRLHRQRRSRTHVNVSDSDVARSIAHEHGLSANCDPSGTTHSHIHQDNQTDWEFLRSRADLIGFELFINMEERTLVFRPPEAPVEAPEQCLGENLLRLRLRLSAPAQVDNVVVHGWDPATKREIEGRATAPSSRAQIGGDHSRSSMVRKLGGGSFVVANQPVRSQAEADALARSVYDEIAGEFIQLEGECLGDWRLRPGQSIRFKNLGQRFDHDYYLSATRHHVTASGYTTHFVVSGRRPHTLNALLDSGPSATPHHGTSRRRYHGVVVGIVTNNKDSDHSRVKVRFPWLGDEETHWARIASPMAGEGRGFQFIPEIGDEVLVGFEHGDVNFPYVLGGLWNGCEKPPKHAPDIVGPTGKVNQRVITSRLGHTITLDDSDDHPSVSIVDKTGRNCIELDSRTNALNAKVQGDLTLEAQGRVTITGRQGVSIHSDAEAEVRANGDLTLKGSMVYIN